MSDTRPAESRELITVLGASGFVGSAVVAALAGRPVKLRLVARDATPVSAGSPADIELRDADLAASDGGSQTAGSDAVIHLVARQGDWRLAGGDPAAERVNVSLMRKIVQSLGQRPRGKDAPVVIFAGSSTQVGTVSRLPIDGTEEDHPETAFDRQKQRAEQILMEGTAQGLVRGISLRMPTVFGLGPQGRTGRGVIVAMVRRALAGEPITMWHDGSVRRDLLHVSDAAFAFTAALDHADALAGRHWLVGTGQGEPLGDVFRAISEIAAEVTGAPPVPVRSVPAPRELAAADLQSMVVDSSVFRSVTGWYPRTALRDGLRQLIGAMAARGSR